MTELKDILKNDIDRTIDGVIKADDKAHILREAEEYVITRELKKHLGKLAEGYNDSIDKIKRSQPSPYNGVWISGYFGSGKSHLLKMLAYLFENREVDGKKISDIFLEKIDDQFLKANIKKMLEIKSKSILFNIDQVADAAHAAEDNAILFIFEKVFNRMAGYFPENRNIAEFERHLDEENSYGKFMEDYRKITGKSWAESRTKAFGLGREKLIQTLVQGSGIKENDARALIDNYKQAVPLSVETFCSRVKKWLDSREDKNCRLNFFIDEVGQFIAGKTRLMLNLQTIAETLATMCGGRVWIFVTSQQDLRSVVGDPTISQIQDYSKIHARFYYRISLSSADVQEVIQKRLLDKNREGTELLSDFFMKEKETLRTVFRFDHGGKDIQFRDRDQFIMSYPFQAYQYNLLQESLKTLSEHNAFMGRHVSRGERSMLEIFQDVAKSLKSEKLFMWASFDQMFNGIRETLDTGLLNAVNTAERNLKNPLSVKILKILLLVKYVRDFRATPEHIRVLLVDSLETDLSALDSEIAKALTILEHQTYIQRNGLVYEYLTNEEKDVEEEIKSVSVENDSVRKFINDIMFTGILKSSKIRCRDIAEDYSYRRIVDSESAGSTPGADLAIHIVTPFHPNFDERTTVLNQSMGKSEMIVFLDGKDFFYRDLKLYFQTDIYCRQTNVSDPDSRLSRIISDKQHQNSERRRDIIERIKELTGKADIYIMGDLSSVKIEDPKERLETAFQSLIAKAYPKLQMIKSHYAESSLKKILYPDDSSALYAGGYEDMDEAQKEMFSHIQRKHAKSELLTLRMIYEDFCSKQYGWYFWAISCTLAKLFAKDSIEFNQGSRRRERDDVFALLSVKKDHEQVRVIPAPVISQENLESLKKLYSRLFHKHLNESKARDAENTFRNQLLEKIKEIEHWQKHDGSDMPFLKKLDPLVKRWREIAGFEENHILEEIDSFADILERDVIDEIDPLSAFMSLSGTQLSAWRQTSKWFETAEENLSEIGLDNETMEMKNLLCEVPYKNNTMKKALELFKQLKEIEKKELEESSARGKKDIENIISSLSRLKEYAELSEDKRTAVCEPLENLSYSIDNQKQLSGIKLVTEIKAPEVLEKVKKEIHSLVNPETEVSYATEKEKKVVCGKIELVTEDDVKDYSEKLKSHYISLVQQNKRIGL